MLYSTVLCLALGIAGVHGVPWPGAQPTAADGVFDVMGRSPVPTGLAADPANIFKREETRTCGYIDKDYGNAATCNVGYYCAFNEPNGVFGCCSGALTACSIKTTCYPSSVVPASCNVACQNNEYNRVCTAGANTRCIKYVWDLSSTTMTNYGCDSIEYTSTVYTTATNAPSGFSTPIFSTSPTTPTGTTSTPASTTSAVPVPAKKSSTPIGAIVGGVVGGIAVIGAICLGLFFILRRSKKDKAVDNPQMAPLTQNMPPPSGPTSPVYMQQPPHQQQPYMYAAHKGDQAYISQEPYSPPLGSPPMQSPPLHSPMGHGPGSPPPLSPAPPYVTELPGQTSPNATHNPHAPLSNVHEAP